MTPTASPDTGTPPAYPDTTEPIARSVGAVAVPVSVNPYHLTVIGVSRYPFLVTAPNRRVAEYLRREYSRLRFTVFVEFFLI